MSVLTKICQMDEQGRVMLARWKKPVSLSVECVVRVTGLVAEVLLDGQMIGSVHLSGTTPPEELTELWTAGAVDGANSFLTEQEAIQRTVNQARRNRWQS